MSFKTVFAIVAFGVFLSPAIGFCEEKAEQKEEQKVAVEQSDKDSEKTDKVDVEG